MKYPQLVSMPSAVSEWLEEQLEARGIDAVVYTRYILSLLYRDPVDIICPDQDLLSNNGKDLRRSGGGRKRFCRSTDYAHADADQLKRSAAVECLKSASDQKCGIESLVDELCEKLKEVKSDTTTVELFEQPARSSIGEQSQRKKGTTSQDPAKQYYAAFPALSASAASPKLITLIPKWFGSPKKKGPKRGGQSRSSSCEEKLHLRVDAADNMKARAANKRFNNYYNRNNNNKAVTRKPPVVEMNSSDPWDMYNNNNNVKNTKNLEAIWDSVPMDNASMYDDLPVDIRDLLDSPPPSRQDYAEINLAFMGNNGEKKKNNFIQCGTNIKASIWTTATAPMEFFDNCYNTKIDSLELIPSWPVEVKENATNSFFETYNFGNDDVAPWKLEKWSENDDLDAELDDEVAKSLMKLNHCSEESGFVEYKPLPRLPNYGQAAKPPAAAKLPIVTDDKDDLLNSASSHFKPINEKAESGNSLNGRYADGTTFVIPSTLDKVNYKRSDSGLLYVEPEFGGIPKKYFEHKKVSDELTIKVRVKQNDKACQTDGDFYVCDSGLATSGGSASTSSVVSRSEDYFCFPGEQELLRMQQQDQEPDQTKCSCCYGSLDLCSECLQEKLERADSVVAEIFGKDVVKCEKCNKDCQENNNIWSDVCMECINMVGGEVGAVGDVGLVTEERDQFREDIRQDWEELLTDISSVHRNNLEQLPVAEVSCNINELITGAAKEWKPLPMHSQSFSFATRLQEDCLLKLAPIPTLRSVTL
ncbi:PREDICTED: uncharacterized protein LOC108567598 [Nicrophorus vespilloides]|uniref:Uncharacterized protein LOC108567598 n=1 Tax=Nicrophorus vespilloides TaxID=110193 RepID=A0ABM1NA43_NICVS|nr:PREDICTED: uncharacterized protein LOC108567598 [Nicrophorus vespilloides]XP_017783774.1 PREDICTED: uncharacterized protein LOC108567598 [Nicrophorus vespilloides]